jgi:hypothetical protein
MHQFVLWEGHASIRTLDLRITSYRHKSKLSAPSELLQQVPQTTCCCLFSSCGNAARRHSLTSFVYFIHIAKYTFEYVIRQEIIMPTAYTPGILLSLKGRQIHLFKKSYLHSKFPTRLSFRKSRTWTHNYEVCPDYASPKFATHYHKIWYCGSTLEATGLILAYVYDSSRTPAACTAHIKLQTFSKTRTIKGQVA